MPEPLEPYISFEEPATRTPYPSRMVTQPVRASTGLNTKESDRVAQLNKQSSPWDTPIQNG